MEVVSSLCLEEKNTMVENEGLEEGLKRSILLPQGLKRKKDDSRR